MMSPVRVRTSPSAISAIPKSVSFATPPPSCGLSGQMMFEGLTSRCTIAARVSVLERVAERHADEHDVAIGQVARRGSAPRACARARARTRGRRRASSRPDSYSATIPGCDSRAAAIASRSPRASRIVLDRDPLDGDLALEALVAREVDDAHPAGADPPHEAVAVEDHLARRERHVRACGRGTPTRHSACVNGGSLRSQAGNSRLGGKVAR